MVIFNMFTLAFDLFSVAHIDIRKSSLAYSFRVNLITPCSKSMFQKKKGIYYWLCSNFQESIKPQASLELTVCLSWDFRQGQQHMASWRFLVHVILGLAVWVGRIMFLDYLYFKESIMQKALLSCFNTQRNSQGNTELNRPQANRTEQFFVKNNISSYSLISCTIIIHTRWKIDKSPKFF